MIVQESRRVARRMFRGTDRRYTRSFTHRADSLLGLPNYLKTERHSHHEFFRSYRNESDRNESDRNESAVTKWAASK